MGLTSEVCSFNFQHRGKEITLVDTPGFDDSEVSDQDILLKLLEWLKKRYEANQKLSGIYLHRIGAPRMQGSALRNFGIFKHLCGESFYRNVILGTTCWDLVDAGSTGARRESQLKEKGGFWHALVLRGSQVCRVPSDRDAARDLIYDLALRDPAFLVSQKEMGSGNLRPDQVSASWAVDPALSMVRRENERALEQARDEFKAALRERKEKARAEREKARQRHDQLLREQEMERERVLRFYREKEEQRAMEMRALEGAMRLARIWEAGELEMQRKAAQKRLDTERFKADYVALCRAAASGSINIPCEWDKYWLCLNCLKKGMDCCRGQPVRLRRLSRLEAQESAEWRTM
ncbi:hypothetical protein DL765_001960 [Monosporascus sp. GIB2]|nr:hypothetical protein DL765_001960 [Monosporascus sp. GIB2]